MQDWKRSPTFGSKASSQQKGQYKMEAKDLLIACHLFLPNTPGLPLLVNTGEVDSGEQLLTVCP